MVKFSALHHDPGVLEPVLDWVDVRFGPIRNLWGISMLPPDPRWWIYGCDLARLPIGTWYSEEHFGASGASIDPNQALQRALGEAIERYCAMSESMPANALSVRPADNPIADLFPVCAPDEPCPDSFKQNRLEVPVTHVWMRRLSDHREVLVPAAHVHLAFSPGDSEPMVGLPISTGLAFHPDAEEAIWSSLCEVAERDAMMLMWWTRSSPKRIDIIRNPLPESVVQRLQRLKEVGLTAHLFDISTNFRIPTVFCLVTGDRHPYLIAGASCHADPTSACSKAIDEAASARFVTNGAKWSPDIPSTQVFDWVRHLEHHIMLYAGWHSSPAFEFLWQSQELISFDDFEHAEWWPRPFGMSELERFGAMLETQELTALWLDITEPEAKQFGHVIKVVVPEMVPLSQNHNARWLATPRLLRAMGLRQTHSSAFNRYPHPFA
jgi:ribosomal protein S12 methylthiotransferase accessory factor